MVTKNITPMLHL